MLSNFFKDLTVIELSSVLAGPAVGMFFAELGARVIKVEHAPSGGDVTRQWKLPSEPADSGISAYYCSVNWQKEVWMLDLKKEEDYRRVLALVESADLLISNFRSDSAKRLGIDFAKLTLRNPRLIYAHLSGFGPEDSRPAYDVVLQAEAGYLHMCGEADRDPVKMPVALIDLIAAHQLKEGILLALLHRARTGEGRLVEVSLMESALASLANQATNWLMAGHIPERLGSAHPNIAPYGDLFLCKDSKHLVLAIGNDPQFRLLCTILGLPELADDKRFSENASRVVNRRALLDFLTPVFQRKDGDTWMQLFRQHSIPAGRIRNMREVFELPQAQAMILEEDLPDGRVSRRVKTVAFKFGEQ